MPTASAWAGKGKGHKGKGDRDEVRGGWGQNGGGTSGGWGNQGDGSFGGWGNQGDGSFGDGQHNDGQYNNYGGRFRPSFGGHGPRNGLGPYMTDRTYEPGDGYRYPLYFNPATGAFFYYPVAR